MGLQIWLPLLGSTTQQGLSNAAVTGCSATTNNSGKIGKCYSFDGTGNQYIIGTQNYFTNATAAEWSYACWIKINNSHNGCIWSCRSSVNNAGMTIFYYSGSWIFDDGNRWQFIPNTTISSDIWYHICFTRSVTTGKRCFYLNGVLDSTTSTSTAPTNVCTTHFAIGNSQTSAQAVSGNPFNGYLNDVRVYSHALSPKEVEVLARGLVLHYPLTGNVGLPNLLKNSFDLTKWGKESGIACTYDSTKGMYNVTTTQASSRWGIYQDLDVSPSTTYTFSCDMDGDGAGVGLKFYTDTISGWPGNQITLSNGDHGRKYVTLTTDSTQNKCRLYLNLTVATTTSGWYRCPKLEVGSVATPWIPNTTDSVYESLNYNPTIEYDVSGYNYNGTRISSPLASADTARYSISTSFDGVDDCIQFPFNTVVPTGTNFTANIWFKKSALGSKSYETLWGGPSGFEMDTRAGAATTLQLYMANHGGAMSVFEFNKWYMVTMVNDGTNEMYYVNGVLINTQPKKSMPSGNYFIGAWQTSTGQNYKGFMSDFRIYATALSPSQVAELYNTSASIANNGTLLAYEFIEK